MNDRPVRADGIEVNEVDDGFVVYDPVNDRVHYLNHTAALVLELCTGEHTDDQVVDLIGTLYDLPQPPMAEVTECLAQLREEGLVG